MSPRFSIALLSEDGARSSSGLEALVGKFFRRFEDDGRTRRVELLAPDPSLRPILASANWRSGSARHEKGKRDLFLYIARKISEGQGFVLFHYDGDTAWSQRARAQTPTKFAGIVRVGVERALRDRTRPADDEVARRMGRLLECVPYYSVEAWLYQATGLAADLCREHHDGAHVGVFLAWEADRASLDEVLKPKDTTCLHDAHNAELGRRVPVREVLAAGGSLSAFHQTLRACGELADALAEL